MNEVDAFTSLPVLTPASESLYLAVSQHQLGHLVLLSEEAKKLSRDKFAVFKFLQLVVIYNRTGVPEMLLRVPG